MREEGKVKVGLRCDKKTIFEQEGQGVQDLERDLRDKLLTSDLHSDIHYIGIWDNYGHFFFLIYQSVIGLLLL